MQNTDITVCNDEFSSFLILPFYLAEVAKLRSTVFNIMLQGMISGLMNIRDTPPNVRNKFCGTSKFSVENFGYVCYCIFEVQQFNSQGGTLI